MSAKTIRCVVLGLLLASGCGDKPGGMAGDSSAPDSAGKPFDTASELPLLDAEDQADTPADQAEPPDALPPEVDVAGAVAVDSAPDTEVETQPPVPLADCATPTLKLKASHKTLIPPPVPVNLSAAATAGDVSAGCSWSAGPPEVCELLPGGKLRKKGDGVCSAICTLADGRCGAIALVAKKQEVLYLVGGHAPGYKDLSAQITRLRIADGEWDINVATMPEKRERPSVLAWKGKLLIAGGFTHGAEEEKQFDPVNFPKCPEAIHKYGGFQGGCLAVRQLDLADGAWSEFTQLPANRWKMGSFLVGERWYLTGGYVTKPVSALGTAASIYIELSSGAVVKVQETKGQGCTSPLADRGVVWQGSIVSFNPKGTCHAKLDLAKPTTLDWQPLDIGWPCPTGPAGTVFSVPGTVDNLFVLRSVDSGPGCPSPTTLTMSPHRYVQGKWSEFSQMSLYSDEAVAVGAKTAYVVFQEEEPIDTVSTVPVLALDSVNGPVKQMPLAPQWRYQYGTAVIVQ